MIKRLTRAENNRILFYGYSFSEEQEFKRIRSKLAEKNAGEI
jgi:hypothetical protein